MLRILTHYFTPPVWLVRGFDCSARVGLDGKLRVSRIPAYVFGLHDVATLAHGSHDLVGIVDCCLLARRNRIGDAESAASVRRHVELHTVRYTNFASVS